MLLVVQQAVHSRFVRPAIGGGHGKERYSLGRAVVRDDRHRDLHRRHHRRSDVDVRVPHYSAAGGAAVLPANEHIFHRVGLRRRTQWLGRFLCVVSLGLAARPGGHFDDGRGVVGRVRNQKNRRHCFFKSDKLNPCPRPPLFFHLVCCCWHAARRFGAASSEDRVVVYDMKEDPTIKQFIANDVHQRVLRPRNRRRPRRGSSRALSCRRYFVSRGCRSDGKRVSVDFKKWETTENIGPRAIDVAVGRDPRSCLSPRMSARQKPGWLRGAEFWKACHCAMTKWESVLLVRAAPIWNLRLAMER